MGVNKKLTQFLSEDWEMKLIMLGLTIFGVACIIFAIVTVSEQSEVLSGRVLTKEEAETFDITSGAVGAVGGYLVGKEIFDSGAGGLVLGLLTGYLFGSENENWGSFMTKEGLIRIKIPLSAYNKLEGGEEVLIKKTAVVRSNLKGEIVSTKIYYRLLRRSNTSSK